jgi:hypothetical protein
VLARASSINDKPAIVTVTDVAGGQVAKSKRDKETFTLYGPFGEPLAELVLAV